MVAWPPCVIFCDRYFCLFSTSDILSKPITNVFPFPSDAVYVLCYSLILLSIDLTSPHVKNKMSKREFIRNTRRAAQNISEDFVGHLYDNIYLIGHVAA